MHEHFRTGLLYPKTRSNFMQGLNRPSTDHPISTFPIEFEFGSELILFA